MSLKNSAKKDKSVKLSGHDTAITLGNSELVFRTFMECLKEGDFQSAREVLSASLRHLNKSQIEKRYHIPRRTAYNLLNGKVMPNLELVAKVCQAIGQESARK